MPETTRVEIEHHYGWTTHDYPVDVAPDLPTAARLAVRETHTFLTDANHISEPGSHESPHSGSVVILRTQDAVPFSNPRLARIAEAFGNKAGDYWFSTQWREWHPHGTLAVDDHGRRWAMVRLSTGYGKWECLTDLTMSPWDVPGPCATRACCGSGNLEGKVCPWHGGPWRIGGQADAFEIRRSDAVRLDRHLLMMLAELHHGHRTATQVAVHLRLGRGQAGRDALARAARRLLARLQQAPYDADQLTRSVDVSVHAVPHVAADDVVAEVLRLAPQTWCTRRRGT